MNRLRSVRSGNCQLLIACCLFLIGSCKQIDVYERNTGIPNYEWKADFTASGSFTITDTVSHYGIYLVLRHTDAYKYNNIWLSIELQTPDNNIPKQKLDIKLGDDVNGWQGSGMNDIWEIRQLLGGEPRQWFKKGGECHFKISQVMRDDPLNGIMSVGLRLEKKEPR
jgi:gliding motility-associated lipoprotein GldH